ncbi:interferon gamma receptor 2 isoform X2 [Pithys albifrons albifrons]|uniref:interferon gamma receptor 2 isoform X2 n=1 Tax=Pithys albifrons albifrons TaxID=3385563 RepID=UPI003A5D2186
MPGRAPLPARPRRFLRIQIILLVLLLLLLLPGSARTVGTEPPVPLPAPKDVQIHSYNFQSLLSWSPVPVAGPPVLYTVQYRTGAYSEWHELNCTRIPLPPCPFPGHLQKRRWTLFLRVRAELGALSSPWAHVGPFVAERDTTLSPPRVGSVSANPDSLLLSVTPPFTPEPGERIHYRVSYWENTTSATAKELREHKALIQLGHLKEATLYCFSLRVEVQTDFGELLGQLSAPECHSTATSEATRAGYIALLCLLGLLLANLGTAVALLLWRHHSRIKHWAEPPLRVPLHVAEFLRDPAMPVLEELDNSTEEDPQAVVLEEEIQGWGSSSEGDDAPSANTSRDKESTEVPPL